MSGIFFTARDKFGWWLYETDGTAEGTKQLADYTDFNDLSHAQIGNIYGTAAGAFVLSYLTSEMGTIDFYSSSGSHQISFDYGSGTEIQGAYSDGNLFYYLVRGATTSPEHLLNFYVSDGTEAGTTLLQWGATDDVSVQVDYFFSWQQSTWVAYRQQGTSTVVAKIEDGAVTPMFNIDAGGIGWDNFHVIGDKLVFADSEPRHGEELWVSDGTAAGTHLLTDINPGTESSLADDRFATLGNQAFFVANDDQHGYELWVTDGTTAGTHLLKDLAPGSNDGISSGEISRTAVIGSELFFLTPYSLNDSGSGDTRTGYKIWRTDGTSAGTEELHMTYQGQDIHGIPTALGVLGSKLVFEGFLDDNQSGSALFSYDVNTGKAALLGNAVPQGFNGVTYVRFGDNLIFSAGTGSGVTTDNEVWITDGTAAGTYMIKDIYPGSTTSSPLLLTLGGQDDYDAIALSGNALKQDATAGTVIGTLSGTDPDLGSHVTFSLLDNPDNVFTINGGVLVVAGGAAFDAGTRNAYAITVRVTDDAGHHRDKAFIIHITDNAPILAHTIVDQTLIEDTAWSFTVPVDAFTDADGDALTYAATLDDDGDLPSWLSFDGTTRTFTGTPPHGFTGVVSLKVTASDGDQSVDDLFDLTITPPDNGPPTRISLSASAVAENVEAGTVIGTVSGIDPDADDTLTFSLVTNPGKAFAIEGSELVVAEGAKIDFETHPSYTITLRVTDEAGLHFDKDFTIRVTDVVDKVLGTSKGDTLHGAAGADIITGFAGKDKLYGEGGPDIFVFLTGDSGKTHAKADTIFDFTTADAIDLTGWDANSKKSGVQEFSFIDTKAFGGHAGQLHFIEGASDTWIEGDTDGNGKADFTIHLDDAVKLTTENFHLIA